MWHYILGFKWHEKHWHYKHIFIYLFLVIGSLPFYLNHIKSSFCVHIRGWYCFNSFEHVFYIIRGVVVSIARPPLLLTGFFWVMASICLRKEIFSCVYEWQCMCHGTCTDWVPSYWLLFKQKFPLSSPFVTRKTSLISFDVGRHAESFLMLLLAPAHVFFVSDPCNYFRLELLLPCNKYRSCNIPFDSQPHHLKLESRSGYCIQHRCQGNVGTIVIVGLFRIESFREQVVVLKERFECGGVAYQI